MRAVSRWVVVALVAALCGVLSLAVPAQAAAAPGDEGWSVTDPTVFAVGDSLTYQCGDGLGVGARSLGMIGWLGGTTTDLRARLSSTAPDWPFMTEPSHETELADFRSAGTLILAVGTNDARLLPVDQTRANVEWFMQQAAGRPVLWLNVYYPAYAAKAEAINAVLADAATRHPNLRVLDWYGMVTATPSLVRGDDRLHIADYQSGCRDGRFELVRQAIPPVAGASPDDRAVPVPVPSPDPVAVKHAATGGDRGPLGPRTGPTVCGLKYDSCQATYANGIVYWTAAGGAHAISNTAVLARYEQEWGDLGLLGLPTVDTVCGLPGGGCDQAWDLQRTSITWSPASGAHVVRGDVRDEWRSLGASRSVLGHPTTDEYCGLNGGGCGQAFQGGWLYWSPATGAHPVWGAVHGAWSASGWETGQLGYPTTGEYCRLRDGGCGQAFQGGSVYWAPASGAHAVWGAIRDRWAATGWENGPLRYPVTGELCGLRDQGCGQVFQGGSVYWTPATGAQQVWGAVRDRWASLGYETGTLGYPSTGEYCRLRDGGCGQGFQGGSVYWSPRTGAQPVWGAIRDRWAATGWENGPLGYPTTGELCGLRDQGCGQVFQGGSVYWSPRTGAQPVWGAIRDRWAATGWENGPLGYPTSGEVPVPGGVEQHFQGGVLFFSHATGQVR